MKMYTYIEVKKYKSASDRPVKRMDVSGKTERTVDLIEAGLNRNMNHKEYYTISFDSETPLEVID